MNKSCLKRLQWVPKDSSLCLCIYEVRVSNMIKTYEEWGENSHIYKIAFCQ